MITVDDKPMEWLPGMTVSQVLAALDHTEFCAAVRLNGKLVSSPHFDTSQVPDNAVIRLLPLIAGGVMGGPHKPTVPCCPAREAEPLRGIPIFGVEVVFSLKNA